MCDLRSSIAELRLPNLFNSHIANPKSQFAHRKSHIRLVLWPNSPIFASMNDPRQVYELEHEKTGKLMWKYFLPAFASMMANALYNVVDRIYIGQGVDALALSGLTVVSR